MEYTTEQQAELFRCCYVWFNIILAILVISLVLYYINRFIHCCYQVKFKEKLTDEQRALIDKYENCYPKRKEHK